MKLLQKTNLQFISFSIIAYVLITVVFYLVTEYVIYEEIEYRLKVERQDFEHYVQEQGVWESSCYFVENKIELTAVTDTLKPLEIFKDTLFASRYSSEIDPFRQHSFYSVINNQPYKVNIRKSLIESNKLLSFITGTMLILLSIGLMILFFIQKKESKRIWQPFYESLAMAKSYDVGHGHGLDMPDTTIFEFNELNQMLEKMTHKIAMDYQNLKEFTENASHEIQTPLALISSRIEELIQGKNFDDKQMYWLGEIHQSTIRLSKLHQGLLLLSKIDNGQFHEQEVMNLSTLAKNKALEFEEYLELKKVSVAFDIQKDFVLKMHPMLADALVGNLLNNAIKHNITRGTIKIKTSQNSLEISNTGHLLDFDPEKLFQRFKKQNQTSSSLGLGLAIVKKICDYYGVDIQYQIKDSTHYVEITHRKTKRSPST